MTRLSLQAVGHVARDDAPRETLDDGRLANTGLANQHRIVFRAPAQHLDHAANLFVAADDRIELSAARQLSQILGILFQCLKLTFGF